MKLRRNLPLSRNVFRQKYVICLDSIACYYWKPVWVVYNCMERAEKYYPGLRLWLKYWYILLIVFAFYWSNWIKESAWFVYYEHYFVFYEYRMKIGLCSYPVGVLMYWLQSSCSEFFIRLGMSLIMVLLLPLQAYLKIMAVQTVIYWMKWQWSLKEVHGIIKPSDWSCLGSLAA